MPKINFLYRCCLLLCFLSVIIEFDVSSAVKVTTGINAAQSAPANATAKPRVKKRNGEFFMLTLRSAVYCSIGVAF